MKTIFILVFLIYGFYSWDQKNSKEMENQEKVLLKEINNLAQNDSFKKISKELKSATQINSFPDRLSINEIPEYEWFLSDSMPGGSKIKKTTLKLLNLFKYLEDNKMNRNINSYKEFEMAILEFNKDKNISEEIFSYLIDKPEIKNSDGVFSNLLKTLNYVNVDKKNLLETVEEVLNNNIVDQDVLKAKDLESKYQLLKIKESSRFILTTHFKNREESVAFVKRILSAQKNPLIQYEILSQLELNYPDDALKLKEESLAEGVPTLRDFLLSESAHEKK